MLVRGPSLAASMSRYLIDRIDATSNIELRAHTELTQLHGDPAERPHRGVLARQSQRASKRSGRSAMSSCSSARIRKRDGSKAVASRSTRMASC